MLIALGSFNSGSELLNDSKNVNHHGVVLIASVLCSSNKNG